MLLSDLLEAEVVDDGGESLGRVHDVRVERLARRTPDGHTLKVVGLVIGGRGVRERLGLDVGRTEKPIVDRELIEWERVLEIDSEEGRVAVRRATP
jgi:sporulation protein YlmC with PRC-barrel domain